MQSAQAQRRPRLQIQSSGREQSWTERAAGNWQSSQSQEPIQWVPHSLETHISILTFWVSHCFLAKPGKPGTPEVADSDKDFIKIKWNPPKSDGGSPITAYNVERRDPRTGHWQKLNKDPIDPRVSFIPVGVSPFGTIFLHAVVMWSRIRNLWIRKCSPWRSMNTEWQLRMKTENLSLPRLLSQSRPSHSEVTSQSKACPLHLTFGTCQFHVYNINTCCFYCVDFILFTWYF